MTPTPNQKNIIHGSITAGGNVYIGGVYTLRLNSVYDEPTISLFVASLSIRFEFKTHLTYERHPFFD
jgi:hypothetical protein